MKVSVITVALNAAETIGGTLQSVSSQTHKDVQHIIVDGASTDETLEIINRHTEKNSLVISEPDNGLYDAMNKGISMATGDIVGILNADDTYKHKHVLQQVIEKMQSNGLDALLGDVEFVKANETERVIRRYRSNKFSPERIAWGWMPAHPAMFLNKRVYDQNGLYKTDYKIAADFEYVARIFHNTGLTFDYLPEVLVRMRLGGVSTSGFRNTILLNREVIRACQENNIHTNMLKLLYKYPSKFLEFLRK